jgi:hypothetical protein
MRARRSSAAAMRGWRRQVEGDDRVRKEERERRETRVY